MSAPALKPKQYAFIQHYIKNGFNAALAAKDAGYSQKYADSQAYKLVNHPAIREHLSQAYKEAEKATGVTFQWKITKLIEIIRRHETGSSPQDAKVVIAAIGELNRMQGDYEPTKRFQVSIDATKERMTEARRVYEEY